MRFDILNRLAMGHECDGRTDRQTDERAEPALATALSNDPH